MVELGLGLTDLVRHIETDAADVRRRSELRRQGASLASRRSLAFSSKTVAAVVARELGHAGRELGVTRWELAGAERLCAPWDQWGEPAARVRRPPGPAVLVASTWPRWSSLRRPAETRPTRGDPYRFWVCNRPLTCGYRGRVPRVKRVVAFLAKPDLPAYGNHYI